MVKQQLPEYLKLTDNIVSRSGRLPTLHTLNADPDMRLIDHVDIIGSVAYGQHPALFLHKLDKLFLLFGGDPTANYALAGH